ncbi:MAG: hypothetical protein ACD_45C00607G0005 [uncultured bacterium]|nr:MAG: hypothetical protein ACD_45C00607G0005 [uncultured bacterium]
MIAHVANDCAYQLLPRMFCIASHIKSVQMFRVGLHPIRFLLQPMSVQQNSLGGL